MNESWWWSERRGSAALGFTTRDGGFSSGEYRGLNLGAHVGDESAAVQRNRAAVLADVREIAGVASVHAAFMDQVHGAQVRVITDLDQLAAPISASDGIVTTLPDVALFALVADCVPILLYDTDAGVIAAAHAGRPGMLAGVVRQTLAAMREVGADTIEAVVGPAVCGRCYEVPEQMRGDAAAIEPVCATVTWSGTAAIDVAAGVMEQLRRESVRPTWVPGCTREDDRLYSYRRDGRTGRCAGVIIRADIRRGDVRRGNIGRGDTREEEVQ